jgi:electron-transferring-flavoprotein dehydrogenase
MSDREVMEYDVVVVGAGPSGLATAIRLKQLLHEKSRDFSVCIVEKGSEVGAHILSGAVIDPRALSELFPDWKDRGAPLNTPVTQDRFLFLSQSGSRQVPNWMLPSCFKNHGNYIASLGNLCRWMGQQAEALGVEIYPGFAAAEILFTEDGKVRGVATGDMGIGRNGEKTARFQPGIELHAKYTIFAEGCRGHLGKRLEERYQLRKGVEPQVYGIGLKELWEVKPEKHVPGLVVHTAGWPLPNDTYGGSFLYHLENNQVAVGYVVGLGYRNPYLYPFEEFQRYKTHPAIRGFFEGGRRISYGARAISAGGLQSLPKLTFPGGALVGDDAGFLNASRIKGTHAATKSGMLIAEAAFDALAAGRSHDELARTRRRSARAGCTTSCIARATSSRRWRRASTRAPSSSASTRCCSVGARPGRSRIPRRTMRRWSRRIASSPSRTRSPMACSRSTGSPRFSCPTRTTRKTSPRTSRSRDPSIPTTVNLPVYDGPETRYCPAGVYEFVSEGGAARLQINAQNCVHCKTCDIKDPKQNIVWVVPEGGGGPNYPNM